MKARKLIQDMRRVVSNTDVPVHLVGVPGSGKSQIVEKLAGEIGEFCYINMPLHDASDFKMPVMDDREFRAWLHSRSGPSGRPAVDPMPDVSLRWFQSLLPKDQDWTGICCVEELDKVPGIIQGAILQPLLGRSIGGEPIPKGLRFVICTNDVTHGAGSYELISPLRSRCIRLDLDPDVNQWISDFAIPNRIHPIIISYLSKFEDKLCKFSADADRYPCPRTWEFVSKIIYAFGSARGSGEDVDIGSLPTYDVIAGAIGKAEAAQFLAWAEIEDRVIDPKKIIANPDTPAPNDPDLARFCVSSLASYYSTLGSAEKKSAVVPIMSWCNKLTADMQFFLGILLMQSDHASKSITLAMSPAFKDWDKKFSKYLTGVA